MEVASQMPIQFMTQCPTVFGYGVVLQSLARVVIGLGMVVKGCTSSMQLLLVDSYTVNVRVWSCVEHQHYPRVCVYFVTCCTCAKEFVLC